MHNDIYLNSKQSLKQVANEAKKQEPTDKPYQRQCINVELDNCLRDVSEAQLKEKISKGQANLYKQWLENYACKLHP